MRIPSVQDQSRCELEFVEQALEGYPLVFRDNNSFPEWMPVWSRGHAERLVRQRHDADPWVTIARPTSADDSRQIYVQYLAGTDGRYCVEGGIIDGDDDECWRAASIPENPVAHFVGPDWYRQYIKGSEVFTVSDALAQLWPALSTEPSPPAGFVWEPVTPRHRWWFN